MLLMCLNSTHKKTYKFLAHGVSKYCLITFKSVSIVFIYLFLQKQIIYLSHSWVCFLEPVLCKEDKVSCSRMHLAVLSSTGRVHTDTRQAVYKSYTLTTWPHCFKSLLSSVLVYQNVYSLCLTPFSGRCSCTYCCVTYMSLLCVV